MSHLPTFKNNNVLTMGVELELQLIDLYSFNLAMEAQDFLRRLSQLSIPGELKPEITLSMIEYNSSVHDAYHSLFTELSTMKNILCEEANKTHIGICGGGTHPFQQWHEQRIFPIERFVNVSENYGYLAKQFTVFGQHIHIGCENGDDALYLCHALANYIPQFIALSAASPFHQGVDTNFYCCRLNSVSAFPLSGTPPMLLHWEEFEKYFDNLFDLELVKSMKDFYWDIRPKPEFGTVELRICDTPLTITKAASLAAFAQMLAHWILDTRPEIDPNIYMTYSYNRFRSARYGMAAQYIDPTTRKKMMLSDFILETCNQLSDYANKLESTEALAYIRHLALNKENDSDWIRNNFINSGSLNDTVRLQTELWCQ